MRTHIAAAAALFFLCSGAALAHAKLTGAVPAADAVVTATPGTLKLKFSEGLELKFTGIELSGPDKAPVRTGPPTLADGDDTTLVVPVAAQLKPGVYTVAWHALSRDGHKTHGTYRFTLKP
jgi:methionine-rich copper-binding protein CopC